MQPEIKIVTMRYKAKIVEKPGGGEKMIELLDKGVEESRENPPEIDLSDLSEQDSVESQTISRLAQWVNNENQRSRLLALRIHEREPEGENGQGFDIRLKQVC